MYHCDPDLVNCYGKTAIHYLSMKGHYEAMEALIQIGASVSSIDADGMMPISYACKYNRLQAVKCLLRANCCVEAASDTPLELALRARHFVVAKLLILAGSRLGALEQWVGDVQSAKAEHAQHQMLLFDEQQEPFERCDEERAVGWFQDWLHSPHSLRQICRIWLRQHLGAGLRRREEELPLPQSMKDYLTLKEVEDHHLE
ncbi:hypothetical protein CAPTEDRAFT_169898 [Capitella teleta]|uniref:SOCS box domain-containing protein n=1 Tax=Capitella teleta TaxID=283909 RepID=R7U2K7_CAPTE|nr:hypothetical protein CAPTEDRAFT_169898 [Capitella teleta]|eukprot:ELU00230.1 hypothetical protein CAPTEDRAFT_169898 [Capitella teleta]